MAWLRTSGLCALNGVQAILADKRDVAIGSLSAVCRRCSRNAAQQLPPALQRLVSLLQHALRSSHLCRSRPLHIWLD